MGETLPRVFFACPSLSMAAGSVPFFCVVSFFPVFFHAPYEYSFRLVGSVQSARTRAGQAIPDNGPFAESLVRPVGEGEGEGVVCASKVLVHLVLPPSYIGM